MCNTPQGIEELRDLKKYALESLSGEERLYVEEISRNVEPRYQLALSLGEERFFSLDFADIKKLYNLWEKYRHLKPFFFGFDPKKKMPEVFQSKVALIAWTIWRSNHLLYNENKKMRRASVAMADFLDKFQAPYPPEVKQCALKKFEKVMGLTWPDFEKNLFPYLDGTWEFKWELKLR